MQLASQSSLGIRLWYLRKNLCWYPESSGAPAQCPAPLPAAEAEGGCGEAAAGEA